MGSSRNMAVLGLSVFIGLTVPTWAQSQKKPVDTGRKNVIRTKNLEQNVH